MRSTNGLLTEWDGTVPFAPADSVLAGYRRFNAGLRALPDSDAVPFVPMMDLKIAGAQNYSYGDPLHFDDRGARPFAEGLAQHPLAAHLMPHVRRAMTMVAAYTATTISTR